MSLVQTTLTAACAAADSKLAVTSATGLAVGYQVRVGEETMQIAKAYVAGSLSVPVLRGQAGTVAVAHPSSAQLQAGASVDWSTTLTPQTITTFPIAGRARVINEYAAAGALDLPPAGADAIAVIYGTALAMTLAVPSKDLNGCLLTILGATAAAHTVTFASGIGGGGLTIATFDAAGRCNMQLLAFNELWYPLPSPMSGTLTDIDVAMSS